jgi:hypothetical protein
MPGECKVQSKNCSWTFGAALKVTYCSALFIEIDIIMHFRDRVDACYDLIKLILLKYKLINVLNEEGM